MTVAQCADRLHLSERTILRLIARRELGATADVSRGGRRRYVIEDSDIARYCATYGRKLVACPHPDPLDAA